MHGEYWQVLAWVPVVVERSERVVSGCFHLGIITGTMIALRGQVAAAR
jgi:hypothetical protein